MTALATDIEALNRHLDLHPSDQAARAILADAYEESGDEYRAKCLRLLVKYKKYPVKWKGYWDWHGSASSTVDPHRLPGGKIYKHRAYKGSRSRLKLEIFGAEYLISQWYT